MKKEQLNNIKTNLVKNIDDKLVKKIDKKSKIREKNSEKESNKKLKLVKTLSKKEKSKIKKTQWHESRFMLLKIFSSITFSFNLEINLIKSQLKESKAKVKRDKTVITGDMKELEDALLSVNQPEKTNKKANKKQNITKPKAVQRESIRTKQA